MHGTTNERTPLGQGPQGEDTLHEEMCRKSTSIIQLEMQFLYQVKHNTRSTQSTLPIGFVCHCLIYIKSPEPESPAGVDPGARNKCEPRGPAGVTLLGRQFDFLAYSSSQLKEQSVWMVCTQRSGSTPDSMRKWMGDFMQTIHVPAKCAAR